VRDEKKAWANADVGVGFQRAQPRDEMRECSRAPTGASLLISNDEELAVVLGVELAVGADGDGGIGGADGGVEEHTAGMLMHHS